MQFKILRVTSKRIEIESILSKSNGEKRHFRKSFQKKSRKGEKWY